MGDLSAHFSKWEFVDSRTGELRGPTARLLAILEEIRTAIGRSLPIVSGYRSPATNKAAGGSSRSYHLAGRASDIPHGIVRIEQAIRAGAGGIGIRSGYVVHVDDRPGRSPVVFLDP